MDSIRKNMTLLALMALFCLHVPAAPVSGAEISSQPAQGVIDPRFKRPLPGKQTEKSREEGAGQAQRAESRTRQKNNSATGAAFRATGEQQRDDNAPRGFQRLNRENSRVTASDSMNGKRAETRTQRSNTFNSQGSIKPAAELMGLDTPNSRTQSAPRESNVAPRQTGDDNAPRGFQRLNREKPRKTSSDSRDGKRTEERTQRSNTSNSQGSIKPAAELMGLDTPNSRKTRDDNTRQRGTSNLFRLDDDRKGRDDDSRRKSGSDYRHDKSRSFDDQRKASRSDDHRDKSRSYDDFRKSSRSDDHRDKSRSYDDHRREHRSDDYRGGYRYPDSYHRPQPDYRHYDREHYRPRPVKHVVHYIPPRHAVILHGHERYHYYSGRYYRPWNSGFILVRPPLGLIVMSLPIGHRVFISAGIPYFVFGDVYYRQVPMGYQVVEPIRDPAVNLPETVSVNIDLLNVRYGPDKTEEVIAQIERYTRLRVIGSAPGWLYVEIEGQEDLRGWVMEEYVSAEPYDG